MSRELLSRQADGKQISRVDVTMDGDGFAYDIA